MKDLSIVIPAYGKDDPIGLWSTIEACIFDLQGSELTYDFRICSNGVDAPTETEKKIEHYLTKAGLVSKWLHTREAQCPARARQLLGSDCDSKYMFLFDNHCLPCHGYFKRGVETMEKYDVDLLHSVTKMFTGYRIDFEYRLTLEKNFWADEGYETSKQPTPYKIAAGGHGGIIHRTSTFKEIGGYWEGFNGYGGEEIYYDLKCWLLGKNVYIDPLFVHAHYAPTERKYQRRSSEGYFLNMLMAANIIGGKRWLDKVYSKIKNQTVYPSQYEVEIDPNEVIDVENYITEVENSLISVTQVDDGYLEKASRLSKEHAAWMAANRKMTLDELLDYFKREGIRT